MALGGGVRVAADLYSTKRMEVAEIFEDSPLQGQQQRTCSLMHMNEKLFIWTAVFCHHHHPLVATSASPEPDGGSTFL